MEWQLEPYYGYAAGRRRQQREDVERGGVRRVLLLMAFLLTACVTLFGMQFVSPATIMTATIAPIHDLTALSSGGFRARANCSLAEADHPGCAGYHQRRRRKADANAGLRVGL